MGHSDKAPDKAPDMAPSKRRTKAPCGNFVRGNWSFRRETSADGRLSSWTVYPKGERSHWSRRANIYQASDLETYVVTGAGRAYDARPDFESAVKLVLSFLP